MSGKTLIERCQRVATWDSPMVAVFHAPFRGYEFVRFGRAYPSADVAAMMVWRRARTRYESRWPMPDCDAKQAKAVCIVDTRTGTVWQ